METTSADPQGISAHVTEFQGITTERIRVLPDGRVSRRDAARYIGIQPKTLAQWELQRRGPPSVKVGGRRYYYFDEIKRFVEEAA